MTTNTPAPAHGIRLTDEEITNVLRRLAIRPGDHDFKLGQCIALAIESALLYKLRAPVANSTLPLEKALHELVSKIAPGLDTGDLLQDAQRASAMLDAMQARAALANGPVADTRLRSLVQEAITWIETGGGPAVSLCADLRAALASAPVAGEAKRDANGAPPCWWIDHGSHGQITQREDEAQRAANEGKRVVSYTAGPLDAAPQASEADPLQGAANWLVQALTKPSPTAISACLMIGYNRAQRLYDAALSAQPGAQKYWLCCGSKDPNHPNRRAPDCFHPDRSKWGTADQHSASQKKER
jgi:hypothetical protein